MRTAPIDAVLAKDSAEKRRAHPSVFVFIACPEAVLASFQQMVSDAGALDTIEPIALPVYPSSEYFEAFLDENHDDIACVTIDLQDPDQANDLLEIAARVTPNALRLATDDGPRAESLLPALRAGASDVLSPPYDMRTAAQALGEERRQSGGGGKGRVAAFLPAQGGNGASTAAIHFAAALAAELEQEDGRTPTSPVLLLDLDFHSDSAAFWLNKRPAYTLVDALEGASPSPSYWRKITTAWNGLDLLAPPAPEAHISGGLLAGLPRVIAAAASTYPWVVLDLPPTLFASSRSLLPLADLVFLVCTPEARSLFLARRRLTDLKSLEIGADKVRVTLNRAGAKRAIEAATVEKAIGSPVSFSIDNDYIEISSAYSDRRLASPSSQPARQFRSMARVSLGLQETGDVRSSAWRRLVGLA